MAGFDPTGGLISGLFGLASNVMQNSAAQQRQQEAQQFNAGQAAVTRDFNKQEAEVGREYNTREAQAARDFSGGQSALARQFNAGESQEARQFSMMEQEDAQNFNTLEAQKSRDFQERMSSTAYQRATSDMRAAGINPMVAYMQGGASTPGGGAAHSGQAAGAQASTSGAPTSQASAGSASAGGMASTVAAPTVGLLNNVLSSAFEGMKLRPQVEALENIANTSEVDTKVRRQEEINRNLEGQVLAVEKRKRAAEVDKIAAETANVKRAQSEISGASFRVNPAYWYGTGADVAKSVGNYVTSPSSTGLAFTTARQYMNATSSGFNRAEGG